jgi:hypothetical protein
MNLRRALAAPLALAILAALTPAAANAATRVTTTDPSQCVVGLVLPKTLAISGYSTPYGARMTGDLDCFFLATWDVSEGLISTGQTISFYSPNTSGFVSWYGGGPAIVHALPRLGAISLKTYTDPTTGAKQTYTVIERASGTMTVKYDSRIAWNHPSRSGRFLTLRASAAEFTTTPAWQPGYAAWPNAKVRFQQLVHGKWHTVKTVRTGAKGDATATVKTGRGTWRAVTATSSSVWGKASGTHTA